DAAERDRRLLTALLEVHGPREGASYRMEDTAYGAALAGPSADEQFAEAFRTWGLDVDATPTAEAAAFVRRRPAAVAADVIAALDEWAFERRRKPPADWRRPADLAAALDDAPGSRRAELRAILSRGGLGWERALGLLSAALRPVPVPFDAGPG